MDYWVFLRHHLEDQKEGGIINVSMGWPILSPFSRVILSPIPPPQNITQGQPLQWPRFLPKHLAFQSQHFPLDRTLSLESETRTCPDSKAKQRCELEGSTTRIHNMLSLILHWFFVIISTAFNTFTCFISTPPTVLISLASNLWPVWVRAPKLPDTGQQPHSHTQMNTHRYSHTLKHLVMFLDPRQGP